MNEITLKVKLPNGNTLTTFDSDKNLFRAIVRALMDLEIFLIEMDEK